MLLITSARTGAEMMNLEIEGLRTIKNLIHSIVQCYYGSNSGISKAITYRVHNITTEARHLSTIDNQ